MRRAFKLSSQVHVALVALDTFELLVGRSVKHLVHSSSPKISAKVDCAVHSRHVNGVIYIKPLRFFCLKVLVRS